MPKLLTSANVSTCYQKNHSGSVFQRHSVAILSLFQVYFFNFLVPRSQLGYASL